MSQFQLDCESGACKTSLDSYLGVLHTRNLQRMRGAQRILEVQFAYLTSSLSAEGGITIQLELPDASSNCKLFAVQQSSRIELGTHASHFQQNPKLGLARRVGLSTRCIETLTRFLRPRVRKLPTPFALSLNQRIPRTKLLQLGRLNSNLSASAHITIQLEVQNMNLNLK